MAPARSSRAAASGRSRGSAGPRDRGCGCRPRRRSRRSRRSGRGRPRSPARHRRSSTSRDRPGRETSRRRWPGRRAPAGTAALRSARSRSLPAAETPPFTIPPVAGRTWALQNGLSVGRARALRDGLVAAGLIFAAYLFLVVAPQAQTVGFDAAAYHQLDIAHPYQLAAGAFGAFTYTPVAARLFAPAVLLDWTSFWWLWTALLLATLVWLGWRSALLVLAFPPVALELYHGNIHLLIAAAIALGFRYPAAWAFVAVTKVTPAIGLIWFAVRREWRNLAIALGVTAALVLLSLVVDGDLWRQWLQGAILPVADESVGQPHLAIPLLIRLPLAVALVAWGGLTDRRWTVPVAATLALPVLWLAGFAILAALPALDRPELRSGRTRGQRAPEAATA